MPPHLHLIMAHGRFNLHVTDYISSIAGAAEDDKHAIVWEGAEGLFQSKHSMVRFTEHSMVVSKIPTANEIKRTETNDFSLLDTRAKRELLANIHAELRARVGLGEAETKPAPPTVTLPAEESAPSSNMKVHPTLSLKVGEVLSGTLLSPSMGSRIFASREDGAISFAKATGKPPRDAGGRVTGPTPETITTLVASDPGKVAKRHAMRVELLVEELYDRTAQAEGKSGKRGPLAMIAGWMPFGKGGFLRMRAQEHAKAHIGEVNLYVTNRGHLEGSVDGTRVARKSGPSWFGYRRKDPSYELWVTHSGVDITRNGMLDWSIEAENKV
ncbi:unnamed protein product [Ectocarpus sp. 4 AP-2014]